MDSAYIADLRRAVSRPRLDTYRPAGGSDLDMAVTYFWNIALCEALYPTLATLEVTLRNAVHNAMSAREGTEWWYYRTNLLEPKQLREFASARMNLYFQNKRQPTAGQVVAELNFGFWTTILSQPYHQELWTPQHGALMKAVFPHLPPIPNNRHYVHQHFNEARKLRNRVFHHEPVWHRPTLRQDHAGMIRAIGWISPTVRESVALIDHFPDTFLHGWGRINTGLQHHFGIS